VKRQARFVGTFSPVPGVAGFEIPLFRSDRSDMVLIQELDESLVVTLLTEGEFENFHHVDRFGVTTIEGGPGVFAIRCLNGLLLAGTQSDLMPGLGRLINGGHFDRTPLLRFRLSVFCRLIGRVADDAKYAWAALKGSASQWAADSWKRESTIRPEIVRNVAMRLRAAGEAPQVIEAVTRSVDVQMMGRQATPLIRIPQSEPWSARCKELLQADKHLLGDATMWWPELESCSPQVEEVQESIAQSFDIAPMRDILSRAKAFLDERLFFPAQADPAIPKALRNRFASTRVLVSQFEKIGDLVRYIERFSLVRGKQMQFSLPTSHATLETIHDEFIGLYGQYREHSSDVTALVPGRTYSGPFLSILSRLYTNRSGGILAIGKIGMHKAVIVKATIGGAKYQDEWIEREERLKYYLRVRNYRGRVTYDETLPENRSIIDYPEMPILVFVKQQARPSLYSYHGIFKNVRVVVEVDGSKWFDLERC